MRRPVPILLGLLALVTLAAASTTLITAPRSVAARAVVLNGVEIEQGFVPMADGVRLAVTYFRPFPRQADERFPLVLEMLPYRKDDAFFQRDYALYEYLARHGIVGVRVDVRGTGASEGRLPSREYSDEELADIEEVIGYLASRPWSNGHVGMQGISWSAFNALMTAMRRPPALKALLVAHGSQDLYGNDIHYIDGALHLDMFSVEIETGSMLPRPPAYQIDAAYVRDRFEREPWLFTYLRNQRDGPFWRAGRSLDTDYASVDVPVYVIGGLLDGYRDLVPALLDNLRVPIRADIGPWNHDWPNTGVPGPNYEWRKIAVAWWKRWLQGAPAEVLEGPPLTAFVRGAVPPDPELTVTPGRFWRSAWPVPGTTWTSLFPGADGGLSPSPGPSSIQSLAYQPSSGTEIGTWWGEPTGNVRPAGRGALVYETAVLDQPQVVVGIPKAILRVSADAPLAHWIVRLEDVRPDGSVSLVTGGLVNGAQRRSRTNPEPIVPGEAFTLEVPMRFTTYTFEPGHRLRLAVTNAQFPMIWPTPYRMTTTLALGPGASALRLPLVPPPSDPPPSLPPVEPSAVRPGYEDLGGTIGNGPALVVTRNPTTGVVSAVGEEQAMWRIDGRRHRERERVEYIVDDNDPARASFLGEGAVEVRFDSGRIVQVRVRMSVESDARAFAASVRRSVSVNGRTVLDRTWSDTIARDLQ